MLEQKEALSSLLAELHYPPQWLTYGVLDPQFLREQSAAFRRGEDTHTEHYRWNAFLAFLDAHDTLNDEQVRQYLELALLDEDRAMGNAAIVQLIAWGRLTDGQLAALRDSPSLQGAALDFPAIQKRVMRATLLRALRASPITDELAEACIGSGDRNVQEALLRVPGVPVMHLIALSERGANKAIRAAATQLLQSRRALR